MVDGFRRATSSPPLTQLADADAAPSHRRPRRRRAVSIVELGGRDRRARRARWTRGDPSTIEEELARVAPFRVTLCNDATSACAAEFFFGEALAPSRLPLFLSRRVSSAADWSSTARSIRAAPATPPRSARCRSPRRSGGGSPTSQLIACASIYQLRATGRGGGMRPLVDLAHARDLGRFRTAARRLDRRGGVRARLRLASRRSPSSTSRRSSSTARCRSTCATA